jgi:hypothetical protein
VQHKQNRHEEITARRQVGMWLLGLIIGVPLLALLGFAAYCATLGASAAWRALGVGCGVAAAATAVGAFLGFLFGIPRTLQGNTAPGPDEIADYRPNTNLEQISDWLTKILVGVGLVELGRAGIPARNLVASIGAALGDTDAARVTAATLLVAFVVWGFVASYLLTRLRAAGAFRASEIDQITQQAASMATGEVKQFLDEQAARDAAALELLERTLSPASSVAPPSQEQLDQAIAAASPLIKAQAFLQASRQRQASWNRDSEKEKMERTIPVFRALIASDTERRYHRNHAQLGYALKDSRNPLWAEAEKALAEAIKRRGPRGWVLYEFNHALCMIHLHPTAASAEMRDAVIADLAVVGSSKQGTELLKERAITDWYTRNGISRSAD